MPSKKKVDMKIGIFDEVSPDIIKAVLETDFSKRTKVHNWKNYVPDALREKWSSLSLQTRIAIYYVAHPLAEKEEWY